MKNTILLLVVTLLLTLGASAQSLPAPLPPPIQFPPAAPPATPPPAPVQPIPAAPTPVPATPVAPPVQADSGTVELSSVRNIGGDGTYSSITFYATNTQSNDACFHPVLADDSYNVAGTLPDDITIPSGTKVTVVTYYRSDNSRSWYAHIRGFFEQGGCN
jgi:hypothetical protein